MKRDIQILTGQVLAADCRKTIAQATPRELYNAVSKAALDLAADAWKRAPGKRVAYLSAEFLVGRLVYANLLTSSPQNKTIQIGIRYFTNQFTTDYVSMYAAIIIAIVPSVLGYALFQKQIISGMTSGAVKG